MIAVGDPALVATVVGVVLVVGLVLNRSIAGKLGNLEVQLGSVDRAVNKREKGAPTVSQDVAEIRTTTAALHELVAEGVLPRLEALERTTADLTARVSALEHPPTPKETP